uniref:Methyltransferase FkbM domain-containing protein n=1 Tax=Tetraselmis chuii TaxID=63592 RepID=A0A7S1X2C0_9CHLO
MLMIILSHRPQVLVRVVDDCSGRALPDACTQASPPPRLSTGIPDFPVSVQLLELAMGSGEEGKEREQQVAPSAIQLGAVAALLLVLSACMFAFFNARGGSQVTAVEASLMLTLPATAPSVNRADLADVPSVAVASATPVLTELERKTRVASRVGQKQVEITLRVKSGGAVQATGWPSRTDSALAERQIRSYKQHALTGFRNKATTDFKILHGFLQSHKAQVKPGQSCATFDVGANLGKYSVDLMGLPVVKDCTIWAFEPNPIVHKQLLDTVRRFTNVRPLNVGVGAKAANLTFYYRPGDTHDTGGSFNVDNSRGGAGRNTREKSTAVVRVITLDELIAAEVPPQWSIPLVKIDVEGLEKDVKLGMANALRAGRISAVYWERQGAYELEPFREEVGFMARHGYAVYIIGSIPFGAGGTWRKHNSRPVLVRVDGGYFHEDYAPHLYKGPGRGGPRTGKPIAINLLAVQAAHPFNALVKSRFTIRR